MAICSICCTKVCLTASGHDAMQTAVEHTHLVLGRLLR
uniref:Uncharacterized protein n=1 Tax=Anguilla anguilla TaxID=7936 RepID=A0A0E9PGB6_ANGAN